MNSMNKKPEGGPEILKNEFAMVEVGTRVDGNGARLVIRDVETGNVIELDPLELEALTRLRHRDFDPLVVNTVQGMEEFEGRSLGNGFESI